MVGVGLSNIQRSRNELNEFLSVFRSQADGSTVSQAQNWHAKGYGGNNKTSALMRLMLANKHITACAKEANSQEFWGE